MSTILDALRKSERSRRASQAPVYGNADQRRAPPLLSWATLLAGLALLAALATIVFLMQRRPPPVEALPPAERSAPSPTADAAPVVRPPIPPAPVTMPAPVVPLVATKPVVRAAPRVPAQAPAGSAPSTPMVSRTPVAGSPLPLWSSLAEAAHAGLPVLQVTIHVYAPDEHQRILYINNEPRVRGEEVLPGVVVDDIAPEGAILRYQGKRYLLPRPS